MPDAPSATNKKASKPGKADTKMKAAKSPERGHTAPVEISSAHAASWPNPQEFAEYGVDLMQRQILFFDTLRQRANIMLAHERDGMPPVLNCRICRRCVLID